MDELGGPAAVVLNSELHAAIRNDQLDLYYQPIIDLPSGAPLAMEAMLRWSHPTKGLLRPGAIRAGAGAVTGPSTVHRLATRACPQRSAKMGRSSASGQHQPCHSMPAGPPVSRTGLRCPRSRGSTARPAHARDRRDGRAQPSRAGRRRADRPTTTRGVRSRSIRLGRAAVPSSACFECPQRTSRWTGTSCGTCSSTPRRWRSSVSASISAAARTSSSSPPVSTARSSITALRQRGCDTAQGPYFIRPPGRDEVLAYLATAPEIPDVPDASVVALDTRRHTPVP